MRIKRYNHNFLIACLLLLPGLGCERKVETFDTGFYKREYIEGRDAYEIVELQKQNVYTQKFYEDGQLRFSNSGKWVYINKNKDHTSKWPNGSEVILFSDWLSGDDLLNRERIGDSTKIEDIEKGSVSAVIYKQDTFSFDYDGGSNYFNYPFGDYWPANNLIVTARVNSKENLYGVGYSADLEKIIQTLSTQQVPHHVARNKDEVVVTIGKESEYLVQSKLDWLKIKRVSVQINYEHPVFKEILKEWIKQCGTNVDDDFYKLHTSLSPSVLKDIQTRWQLDLSDVSVAPKKFGKHVFVFASFNITAQLTKKLKAVPHRTLQKGEFIKSDEFEVKGDDPLDTVVYGWKNVSGDQLFVVTASTWEMTTLSLWIIPPSVPVEVKMGEVSG